MAENEREATTRAKASHVDFWRRYDEMEARLSRPLSERMLELAGVTTGMRILDVAAGRGEPALPAAHRVGPQGSVVAIDKEDGVLEMASETARREGLGNLRFVVGDAQTVSIEEKFFDVATSRWGLMYMPAPERALAVIHRALKSGAPLVIASWVHPSLATFAALPRQLLGHYRAVPPPNLDEPGTFRHADPNTLETMLERTGFSVEASEELEVPVVEDADASAIVTWIRAVNGPLMSLVAELPEQRQRAWEHDLARALEAHRIGGMIRLGGVSRLTLARTV